MLPKIVHPTFTLTLPYSQKKLSYRPWTVGEEKALLVAKQSGDPADVFGAVTSIAAAVTSTDVSKLPTFEVEYLFVKARSVSVDNRATVTYVDPDDEKSRDFEVDLNKVQLAVPDPLPSPDVQVNKDVSLTLRYLPASAWTDDRVSAGEFESMACLSIDKVWEGDQVYDVAMAPREEVLEFVRSLPAKAAESIADFWTRAPHLSYTIEYTNDNGKEQKLELSSLTDFFSFVSPTTT